MELYYRSMMLGGFVVGILILAGVALAVGKVLQKSRENEDHFDVGRSARPDKGVVKVSLPRLGGRDTSGKTTPIAADLAEDDFGDMEPTESPFASIPSPSGGTAVLPPPPSLAPTEPVLAPALDPAGFPELAPTEPLGPSARPTPTPLPPLGAKPVLRIDRTGGEKTEGTEGADSPFQTSPGEDENW